MKRAGLSVAFSCLLIAGCARTSPATRPTPSLRIEEQQVVYRGTRLTLGSRLDAWKRAFGEPSRLVDRDGGIFVWDELGLAVTLRRTFPMSDPHVASLRVFLAPRKVDLWPRAPFRGVVEVVDRQGGATSPTTSTLLDASTTRAKLIARPEGAGRFGLPYLTSFTILRFADQPSGDGALVLVSVAIDPDAIKLPWEISTGAARDR
jgi:hypothetical protein